LIGQKRTEGYSLSLMVLLILEQWFTAVCLIPRTSKTISRNLISPLQRISTMSRFVVSTTVGFALLCCLPVFSQVGKTPSIVRVSPVGVNAREPQAAVGKDGSVWVTYGVDNVLYCTRSANGGVTFDTPVKVGEAGKLSLGMRRGPRIAVAGKFVVISAVYGGKGGGADGDLMAWQSSDGGKTWKGASKVNNVPGSAREGLHAMTASSDGTLACAWLDLRSKGTTIYAAVSQNGGETWSANRLVYRSPDGTVCECCHPSLAYDSQGRLYVMWRNALGGARDMYLTRSDNGGKTFQPAQKLGTGTWFLNACPMDGGALAFNRKNDVLTLWRREQEIFLCSPGQSEQKLGDGIQCWLAVNGNTVGAVWLTQRGGQLKVSTDRKDPRIFSNNADDPCVVPIPGDKPRFVVVWQETTNRGGAIYASIF
jgi:hypothetical protein